MRHIKAFDPKKPGGPSNFGPRNQPHLNRFTPEEQARVKYLESLPEGKSEGTHLGRHFRKLTPEEQAGGPQLKAADRTVKLDPAEAGQVACTACEKVFNAGDDVVLHDSETPAGQVPYCPACAKENPMKASMKFKAEFGLEPADHPAYPEGYLKLEGVEYPGSSAPGGMNVHDWVIYKSNYDNAVKMLPEGGFEGQASFLKEHPGEEYPGDVVHDHDFIWIWKGATTKVAEAQAMVDDLNNYPVLDESSMSELENEALEEELDGWAMRDAEQQFGYRNGWEDALTDEEAAWLDGLRETNPEALARIESGAESIYEPSGDDEQNFRSAVRDGLTYGDWTVVHKDAVIDSLKKNGAEHLIDPAATLHQFLAKEKQAEEPGSATGMKEKEEAGQLRLLESLRAARQIVVGQQEIKALLASAKTIGLAMNTAAPIAKLMGGHQPVEVFGSAFFTYPVKGQMIAASITAFQDQTLGAAWAPLTTFGSAQRAASILAGTCMFSFEAGVEAGAVVQAMKQMKSQYLPHAGINLLCAASRARMTVWAKTPEGFEPVVKELKSQKGVDNPWAVAWSMKNRGIKPRAAKVEAGKSKGRFTVDQLIEGGPWWVLELGPSNQMTPFYGPFDSEEDANLKLDNMMTASGVKADAETEVEPEVGPATEVVLQYSVFENRGRERREQELRFYCETPVSPEILARFKKMTLADLVWAGDEQVPGYEVTNWFDSADEVSDWVENEALTLYKDLEKEFGVENVELDESAAGNEGTITIKVGS